MAHATTVIRTDLAGLIRRERNALVRHLPAARDGDVNGVHRARVSSRRLRELLPVAEAALGAKQPTIRRDLRRLTRALGPVREMDVTRSVLAGVWATHGWPPPVLARVDRRCEAARHARRHDMMGRLSRGGASDLPRRLSALATAVAATGDDVRAARLLASRLRRRARVLTDAIRSVGTLYVPAPIHAVRIAGKKLRYTLEIGQAAGRMQVGVPLRELKALQELLGGLNDRQIVQHWLRMAATGSGAGRQTIRVLDACQAALEAECRERHAVFLGRARRLEQLAEMVARDAALAGVGPRLRARRQAGGPAASGRPGREPGGS